MREITAMAVKDLRLLLRDKAGFFFTLFSPSLSPSFSALSLVGEGVERAVPFP